MTRASTPACTSDLACFRNDGHAGDHAYATPETVPQPVATPAPLANLESSDQATPALLDVRGEVLPIMLRPAVDMDATTAPLDVERLARAMRDMCDCIRSDSDAEAWARDIAAAYQADEP